MRWQPPEGLHVGRRKKADGADPTRQWLVREGRRGGLVAVLGCWAVVSAGVLVLVIGRRKEENPLKEKKGRRKEKWQLGFTCSLT